MIRAAFLALAILVAGTAQLELRMSDELAPIPPLAEGPDETRRHDANFDEQCQRHFQRMAGRQSWKVRESRVTQSPKWGMIWRADFDVNEFRYTAGLVNRFVCWKAGADEELTANAAFGQRLQPLGLR